nr:GNAT family N-acetyltransferase [Plastoroseomonas hellenica]
MLRLQGEPGYRVAGIEADGRVVACVAFRVTETLSYGRHICIEEIATLEAYRGRGFGLALMDYVRETGLKSGCSVLHLNSGLARTEARRFYHHYGMAITSFHFRMDIPVALRSSSPSSLANAQE